MALTKENLDRIEAALHSTDLDLDEVAQLDRNRINLNFTNGAAIAQLDLLEALRDINEADGDETRITEALDALQDKVSKYSNDYVYVLYWLTGDAQEVYGPNINTAMNNAGIGAGALSALDFYDQGPDTGKCTWDAEAREWKSNDK